MSNALGIVIAVVLLVAGFVLLVSWWGVFIKVLMAIIPIFLILVGAGTLLYFISEIKSKQEMEKEKTSGEAKPESSK